MSTNTTATAGAVRAAETITRCVTEWHAMGGRAVEMPPIANTAAIIDRETGAAELLAALEAYASVPIEHGKYCEWTGNPSNEALGFVDCVCDYAKHKELRKQARAAIARARGTAECKPTVDESANQ